MSENIIFSLKIINHAVEKATSCTISIFCNFILRSPLMLRNFHPTQLLDSLICAILNIAHCKTIAYRPVKQVFMVASNQNCARGADEEFLNFQVLRSTVEVITAGNQIMVSVLRVKPSIVQSIQQFIIKPMDVAHYEEFRHNYHLYKLY